MVEVVTIAGNKNALGSEAQHLPKRSGNKMPTLLDSSVPASSSLAGNGASPGVSIRAPGSPLLSAPALNFVASLARQFEKRRRALLGRRADRQRDFDAGAFPTFLASTADV